MALDTGIHASMTMLAEVPRYKENVRGEMNIPARTF